MRGITENSLISNSWKRGTTYKMKSCNQINRGRVKKFLCATRRFELYSMLPGKISFETILMTSDAMLTGFMR